MSESGKTIEIDLSNTNVEDLEIKREGGHSTIAFSVEGTAEDVDEETVEEAFLAQSLQPVQITFTTE